MSCTFNCTLHRRLTWPLSKEMCSPIDECYKELYEEEEKYKEIVCEKKSVLEKVSNAEKRVTSQYCCLHCCLHSNHTRCFPLRQPITQEQWSPCSFCRMAVLLRITLLVQASQQFSVYSWDSH